jgi:PAS domain S-box-containing protein
VGEATQSGDGAGPEVLVAFIDALPMALIGVDRDDLVTHWNPAAERIFGWSADEVMGRPYPIVPADHVEEHRMILQDAFQGGRGFAGIETRRQRKDGSLVDVAIWTAPLPLQGSTPHTAVAVVLDLTERKKLEDQLYQAQKMEAVGRLAGGIAHDFNNLITVVTGQSSLLLEEESLPPDFRRSVAEIADAAERAALLTRQLLAFSRRQVLQPVVVSVNGAIEDLSRMLQRLIGEDVEMSIELAPELGHVRVDPVQFQQVLMNLVVNARHAMPDGGRLRIVTSNARIGTETASRLPYPVRTGDYVVMEVVDTGMGMDEAVRSRIFEPFFTTKSAGKGTGLGLSTVYGIVKQSGGYIWVESEPGRGAVFRVYLPRVEAERQGADTAPTSRPAPFQAGAGTVLIAEDEVTVRWLARQILERAGYDVLEAEDGDAAVRVAAEYDGEIHLLLSDIVMPGRRGPEVFERLIEDRPGLRVLFISGYTEEALSQGRLMPDGAAFLPKPFTPARLREAVAQVLGTASVQGSWPADAQALEAELRRLETQSTTSPHSDAGASGRSTSGAAPEHGSDSDTSVDEVLASDALVTAGELCVQAGQRERALRYFGRAIDGFLEAGLDDEAEAICGRILEIAPSVVRARRTLALLAIGRRDVADAVAKVGEYVRAAMEARQTEVAIRQLRTMAAISREPDLRAFVLRELVQVGGGGPDLAREPAPVPGGPISSEADQRALILRAALAPPTDLMR